ncbi:hypothetical protein N7519_001208 [Penicillium mononematosum]|uniref:uncharacterized protein n=1 Tax=Penicillium mononematosum TaxID=268346 RepID=UPI00254801FE|nr:uncharacterized protein N7519_001208 [Penicillium mononematosum]KAJ6191187.1 hypothetical protein N7519_001208 [Penicillium mononematosum]
MCHIEMELATENGEDGWEKTFTLCHHFRSFECGFRVDVMVSFTPDGIKRKPSKDGLDIACKMLLDLAILKAQEVQGGDTGNGENYMSG